MTKPARRFRNLVVEGLMVLLGVLGAFLLEGWRGDRELAREVRQELESVEGELRRNRQSVAVEVETLERVVQGGEALIELMAAADEGSEVVVPDTLIFLGAVWAPTFNASLGAIEALLASGRLSEIHDPALRLGLAGLDEMVADAVEEEIIARAITVEQLSPAFDRLTEWPSFAAIFSDFFGGSGEGDSPQVYGANLPMPSSGLVEVGANRVARNLTRRRVIWHRAAIGEFRRLTRHLDELTVLVEGELQ